MRRFAAIVILLAFAAASPAQARTIDTFCSELRRIVRATGETPPFASLAGVRVRLPGFGERCESLNDRHGRRFACTMIVPDRQHWQRLAAHTARCLPTAIRLSDQVDIGLAQFRTGTALIVIRYFSLPGDSRGLDLSFTVHPIPVH